MLINVKMRTIVGTLTFMGWISFMLRWVEYDKRFITSGPSSVWTFIEDVCAYTMRRLTKISCAGPNYESIRTLSYSFISTSEPTGSEHQRIGISLSRGLCFHARIQRENRGSVPPGKPQC